jgi:HEAT repeat protein
MNDEIAPGDASPDPDNGAEEGPLRVFLGLVVIPLLVVAVCVGVFVGFGWIAYDRQDIGDYLNDLRSSWRPRRAQAAYELSKILIADPNALSTDPESVMQLRRLFEDSEDKETRQYLALVLGYTRDPEAVPLLTAALEESSDSQSRIYLLWALGAIGDGAAVPALVEALTDADPGIRKVAAFALGEVGEPAMVEKLRPLLEDEVADVRWNAALAVTRLGSEAAVPVLHQMLDRQLLSRVPGITPEQEEETMISAVGALAAASGKEALPLLERLAEEDPSLKVRQAALEARKALSARP